MRNFMLFYLSIDMDNFFENENEVVGIMGFDFFKK